MAIDVKIASKLDKDFVKVEANSSHAPTRYFKVPKEKADTFCTTYKKDASKNSTRNYIVMFVSVLGACGIAGIFTKNMKKAIQTITGVVAGIAGLIGGSFFSAKKAISNEEKMLNEFKASEIYPQEKKKMPI